MSAAEIARLLEHGKPEGPAAIHFCPVEGCNDLWESEATCEHAAPLALAAEVVKALPRSSAASRDGLRAAFDAGVDEGDRGFADNPEELAIAFAVHLEAVRSA